MAAKSSESGRGFTLDRMRGHDGVSWTLPVHFGVDNWQPAVSTLPPRLFVTAVHNVVSIILGIDRRSSRFSAEITRDRSA